MQAQLDFNPPRQLQATRALEKANREIDGWSLLATDFLKNYAKTHDLFTGEDVTRASRELGLPQPSSGKAWGTLYRRAQVAGIIVRVDSEGKRSNGNSTPRYRGVR